MNQETLGTTQSPQKSPDHFTGLVKSQTQQIPKHDETCSEECCELVWKPAKITTR